jgi:hypothetical protein
MEHNPNPHFSKAHLTNLNLNNFKMTNYGIKNYRIKVPLNGITSVSDFMKFYHAVQKVLVGDTQIERLVIW